MKKLFTVTALIAALVFAGCPVDDDGGSNNTTDTGDGTRLKINNQSGVELAEIRWSDTAFPGGSADSLPAGAASEKAVSSGQGYIFFKRNEYPASVSLRTQELLVIDAGSTEQFTFLDSTVVVDTSNPSRTRTLGSLRNIVAFYDDAEGEQKPYYEKQGHFLYYTAADVAEGNVGTVHGDGYTPKSGNRSIAIGANDVVRLHIRINLDRSAKLSFWLANMAALESEGTTFSINGEVKRTWTTNVGWSKLEYDLQAGQTDLVWDKKDGFSTESIDYYFLFLDDILIYYAE